MSKLKSNLIYNFIYQLIMLCFPLIVTPYISRTIGAYGIGVYSYNYSVAHYFVIFAVLGVSNYGTRSISVCQENGDRADLSKCFFEIYGVQFICSIIASFVYVIYSIFVSKSLFESIIFTIYVISTFFDITWFFFGIERFRVVLTRNLCVKVLTAVLIFLFVQSQEDIYIYCIIMTLGSLLPYVLLWPELMKYIVFERISVKDAFKKHFLQNAKLFIPVLAVSMYKYMDKIMIGSISNTIELGYYENVEKIVNIPVAFVTAMGTVMLSRMSRIYSNGEDEKGLGYIRLSTFFTMLIASALVFGSLAVLDDFVPLFFGNGFGKCIELGYWMLPTTFFLGLSNVIRTQYLIPLKKDNVFIASVCVGAIVNLICNALLIPRFQAAGAAIGTFFAELSVFIYQYILVRKKIKINKALLYGCGFVVIGMIMMFIVTHYNANIQNAFIFLIIQILIGVLFFCSFSLIYLLCFKSFRTKIVELIKRWK